MRNKNADNLLDREKISVGAIVSALYFISMPLSIVPLPGGISLLKVVSILVGGVLIVNLFVGKNTIQLNSIHFLLGLYILDSVSSWFLLRDLNAWDNLRGLLQTSMIFYLITSKVYNKREQEFFIYVWILIGIITTSNIIFGGVSVRTTERVTIGIGGGMEDPNQLCGYFFLPMLYTLEKVRKKDKFSVFYVVLIVAMIYAIFTTGSRGGLIAIFMVIFMYVFMAIKGFGNKMKIMGIILLFSVVFYFVLFPLLPSSVTERMSVKSVEEDKGSGRFDLWKTIMIAIKDNDVNMIFGYGIGATEKILLAGGHKNTVAHNHWLQIWADQGFLGMSIFAATFIVGFFRCLKRQRIVSIGLFGMLALSMSLTMYAAYKPFWNVLMMSALNLDVWGEKKIELESECHSNSL